jgi:hypothetical protein
MRKQLILFLTAILLIPFFAISQEPVIQEQPAPDQQKPTGSNEIKSGFYLKIGPVFPLGNYMNGTTLYDHPGGKSVYFPARVGAAMDIGFLIYLGPDFANHHLRAGIDATFLSFMFNSVKVDSLESPKTKYWYYYGGQKFGPVISIRPVDKLVIDLSYKLNAYVAYLHHWIRGAYNDEWGKNLTQSEVSMNIRYSIMLFSFQYNFGQVQYDDYDSSKPVHYVDNTTFRFMVGFKF